ncbi:MAG: DUF190 domain-containing protein [Acidimicrobiaceae bacterium]|nr:DUF190 domain-containing protein [Acidimicrobiaceae bacterium]
MREWHSACKLYIYLDESQRIHKRSALDYLASRAKEASLGMTVFRGIEGIGSHHHLHRERILSLSDDLPIVIVLIDTAEKIDSFLDSLESHIELFFVTKEPVEVLNRRMQ